MLMCDRCTAWVRVRNEIALTVLWLLVGSLLVTWIWHVIKLCWWRVINDK